MSSFVMPSIYPVACHTDNIGPGSIFVAIKGAKDDGIFYIKNAIEKGAKKIVIDQCAEISTETEVLCMQYDIEVIRVFDTRLALAQLSAEAAGYPSRTLKILAITGTKGKTTSCFLLEECLRIANYKTALITSVHNKIIDTLFKTSLTTPQPDYLQQFLALCVWQGVEYVVMEVAAQALSLHRVHGISFDGIIFTNFDLDHSEFYATKHDYFAAKCSIFQQAKKHAIKIVNGDDPWIASLAKKDKDIMTFSAIHEDANFYGKIMTSNAGTCIQNINGIKFSCPTLIGSFNGYNMLGVIALLKRLNIDDQTIQMACTPFCGVPGRLEKYTLANGALCYIDKAHNPSSFIAVLSTLRPLTKKLIVVFGAGGERDRTKRPLMGSIATEYADLVIITSDDPRSEDPELIIDEIYAGIDPACRYKVERDIDRERAIKYAYIKSCTGAIIALLGKGADEYQIIKEVKYFFSERQIINPFLKINLS